MSGQFAVASPTESASPAMLRRYQWNAALPVECRVTSGIQQVAGESTGNGPDRTIALGSGRSSWPDGSESASGRFSGGADGSGSASGRFSGVLTGWVRSTRTPARSQLAPAFPGRVHRATSPVAERQRERGGRRRVHRARSPVAERQRERGGRRRVHRAKSPGIRRLGTNW